MTIKIDTFTGTVSIGEPVVPSNIKYTNDLISYAVWDRVLTDDECSFLKSGGSPMAIKDGLLLYWPVHSKELL